MPIAIGAFFAIDALIIAFVLTLWVLSTAAMLRPIIQFLAGVASDVPLFGDDIASAIRDFGNAVENWIGGLVRAAYQAGAQPFISMMTTYADARSGDAYSQRLVMTRLADAVITTYQRGVASVPHPTQTYVTNSSTVNNTYVLANTDAAVTQSETYTTQAFSNLADWAYNSITSVYNDVVDADNRIVQTASQLTGDIAQARSDAQSYTDDKTYQAVVDANSYTLDSFNTLEDYATQVRDYATAEAASTLDAAQSYTDSVAKPITDELSNVVNIVTTGVMPIVSDLADTVEQCVKPNCPGGFDFLKALSGFEDLAIIGALAALLAEAAHDPEATASAIVAAGDAITSVPRAIFRDVTGVG